MIQVRCPKCNTALSLKQPPPAGKIKCPKCAAVIEVSKASAPAAAKPPAANTSSKQPARQSAAAIEGEIDFASIPVTAARPSDGNFPIYYAPQIYDGPIQLDPIPQPKIENEDGEEEHGGHGGQNAEPAAGNQKSGKPKRPVGLIVGIVVAVVVLAVVGGVLYWQFGQG